MIDLFLRFQAIVGASARGYHQANQYSWTNAPILNTSNININEIAFDYHLIMEYTFLLYNIIIR